MKRRDSEFIASALVQLDVNGGKVRKTARELKIPESTLRKWRDEVNQTTVEVIGGTDVRNKDVIELRAQMRTDAMAEYGSLITMSRVELEKRLERMDDTQVMRVFRLSSEAHNRMAEIEAGGKPAGEESNPYAMFQQQLAQYMQVNIGGDGAPGPDHL